MSIPTSEPIPDEDENLPPARRRRDRRQITLLGDEEHANILDELVHQTTPSFDFFLFSLLSGVVLGLGILVDSPVLFFLAAMVAPFMAPMVSLSLAIIVGTGRYFLRTLAASLAGGALVFIGSGLIGLIPKIWKQIPYHQFTQAPLHTKLDWPGFVVLTLGILLTTIGMVRSNQKPLLASAILAYGLYLPVGAAGFGLTNATAHLWPDGLAIFAVYLVWAIVLGTITLRILGFRLMTFFGYFLAFAMLLVGLVVLVGLNNASNLFIKRVEVAMVATTTRTATLTETVTPSVTPVPPTETFTPTHTLIPSLTITPTLVPSATPIWALIDSPQGAVIRAEPKSDAKIVAYILNESLVKVFPETSKEGGVMWVHVATSKGVDGWIVQILLKTATPAPAWQ